MPDVMPDVAPAVSALVRTLPKSPVAIAEGSAAAPAVIPLVTALPKACAAALLFSCPAILAPACCANVATCSATTLPSPLAAAALSTS